MPPLSRSRRPSKLGFGKILFRFIVWIVLPLGLLYGLLWWRADAAIGRQLDKFNALVDVRRSGTVLGLNGDIGIRGLVVTPRAESGLPQSTLRAERAVVRTPGLWWLLRSSLFGVPKEIPSRFGFRLDGAEVEPADGAVASQSVLFPFDLAGCEPAMTPEILEKIAGGPAKPSFEAMMTHARGNEVLLRFEGALPGLVSTDGEMELALGSGELPQQIATATLQNMRVTYNDHGFVDKRNAYCQARTGLDIATFLAQHVEAASQSFAPMGLKPGAAMTQSYAGFSKDGGTITVVARPLKPMPLAGLQGINLNNISLYLDATVRHDDGFAGPLAFLPVETGPVAPVSLATATTAAAAPGSDASAPADSGKPRVTVGSAIPYEDLLAYVGEEVEVSTNINTVRRGTLLGTSSLGVSLKLPAAEGGYSLSLPKYTIVQILLAKPSAAANATGSAENAKKN